MGASFDREWAVKTSLASVGFGLSLAVAVFAMGSGYVTLLRAQTATLS